MNLNMRKILIEILLIFLFYLKISSCFSDSFSSPSSSSLPYANQQIEIYKVLVGDTVRLECPQANPTWFYRSLETNTEDLIVTRHGIINVEYKHRITSHPTQKHKIIFINKIRVDDDGIYTCLYTTAVQNNDFNEYDYIVPTVQQRFMFNVTVYTLINGLTMNIKPSSVQAANKKPSDTLFFGNMMRKNLFEVSENVLTIRENDEALITCIVDFSKPAAQIKFSIGDPNEQKTSLTPFVAANTNIIKNEDKTYKTIYTLNLKAHSSDHGKVIACNADNGLSNQKWENRRILNVMFAPVCKDQENFQYFIGINQTINIECRIKNANPTHINYEWQFSNNKNIIDYTNSENNKRNEKVTNDGFVSRVRLRPSNINDFGEIKCKATNDIGTTICNYELKLGGIPNPPYDCTYNVKNTSAIIYCQLGYHQGDPDIYCYLLRKADNGVYKEHTRSRDACSFIVNDVPENKLNEFWVYTSNKFGHNKDSGVYLTIGQVKKPVVESNGSKTLIVLAAISGITFFLIIICCLCFKIRKGFHDDNDSMYGNDLNGSFKTNGLIIGNENNEYHEKSNKQTNDYNDELNKNYDESENKDDEEMLSHSKYKSSLTKKNYDSENDYENENDDGDTDKKRNSPFTYENPKMYISYYEKPKSLEMVDGKAAKDPNKKKKFLFFNMNNNNKQEIVSQKIHQRQATPFSKRNNKFNKNKYEKGLHNKDYEKTKAELISDLNAKLSLINDSSSPVTDDDAYKTNKKIETKDDSSNTLSTQLKSDSSASNSIQTKLITFTSASSLKDTNTKNFVEPVSPLLTSTQMTSTLERPKLSTFSNNSTSNLYSTIKRKNLTDSTSKLQQSSVVSTPIYQPSSPLHPTIPPPPPPLNELNKFGSSDIYETKFLSNLCEEIELTLNVECVCDETTSSSAQCDSNVNSEISTDSSSHNLPQHKNYTSYSINRIIQRVNNNDNSNDDCNSNLFRNTTTRVLSDNNKNIRRENDEYSAIRKPIVKNIGVLV